MDMNINMSGLSDAPTIECGCANSQKKKRLFLVATSTARTPKSRRVGGANTAMPKKEKKWGKGERPIERISDEEEEG